ncbi:hypothetical protein LTR37_001528 [Vermiconidia calcicola]|uniref:Uncharacterized protein n=1 Tax=Vermiconidia calcicola TaxID=1690605 RepID=A0ACC3NWR1_9PEZI|nr:hypothetical protein LTR37_001528 [Vermiconidia calcicola]
MAENPASVSEDTLKAVIGKAKLEELLAKTHQGRKPTPRPSNAELIKRLQDIQTDAFRDRQNQQERQMYVMKSAYPPSMTPINRLRTVRMSDLTLETHHRGKLLVVRIIGDAVRHLGVHSIAQDAAGDVGQICLHFQDPHASSGLVLPYDALFAIKEPYYHVADGDNYCIRVDHPTDILQLPFNSALVPSQLYKAIHGPARDAVRWKEVGTTAFDKKDFGKAIGAWTAGLEVCSDRDIYLRAGLLHNLALARICSGLHEAARGNALSAILPDDSAPRADGRGAAELNSKSYFHAGLASYHLRDFVQARAQHEQALSLVDTNTKMAEQIRVELDRINVRLRESTGVYNFTQMSASASTEKFRLDHADFTSKVSVQVSKGRGRGLFATQRIAPGDLVLVEKAFCAASQAEIDGNRTSVVNANTGNVAGGSQTPLLFRTLQTLVNNPQRAARLLELHDGGYSPRHPTQSPDGVPAVDVFRVQCILKLNTFASNKLCTSDFPNGDARDIGLSAVWITASYINHACVANVVQAFFGDVMVIRATKTIDRGDEILMPYCTPDPDHHTNQAKHFGVWQFECNCGLCIAESTLSRKQYDTRRKFIQAVDTFVQTHPLKELTHDKIATAVSEAEQLYSQMIATYPEADFKNMPRLGLVELSQWLCLSYSTMRGSGMAAGNLVEAAIRILRNLGYIITRTGSTVHVDRSDCLLDSRGVWGAMHATRACFVQNDRSGYDQYRLLAKELYLTSYGEMREFEKMFADA